MATPVAPLGAGKTGGVTLHIKNAAAALASQGHHVTVMAPDGSVLPGVDLVTLPGTCQPSLASEAGEEFYPIPENSVLGAMWHAALARQSDHDAIINIAHDWLPYYLTDFFQTPVLHMVNMTDVNAPTTAEIARVSNKYDARIAVMTQAQAERLGGVKDPILVSFGLDLSVYEFNSDGQGGVAWAGRISPEKGLEDALAIARDLAEPLIVAGAVDDQTYWTRLTDEFSDSMDYRGFLATPDLQSLLGQARVVLQTQKWHEAFGIVTIEAMACGTPVVAYARGANQELVIDGVTGFLVTPGDKAAAAQAVSRIAGIDRAACRHAVAQRFSLPAYGENLQNWLNQALSGQRPKTA